MAVLAFGQRIAPGAGIGDTGLQGRDGLGGTGIPDDRIDLAADHGALLDVILRIEGKLLADDAAFHAGGRTPQPHALEQLAADRIDIGRQLGELRLGIAQLLRQPVDTLLQFALLGGDLLWRGLDDRLARMRELLTLGDDVGLGAPTARAEQALAIFVEDRLLVADGFVELVGQLLLFGLQLADLIGRSPIGPHQRQDGAGYAVRHVAGIFRALPVGRTVRAGGQRLGADAAAAQAGRVEQILR